MAQKKQSEPISVIDRLIELIRQAKVIADRQSPSITITRVCLQKAYKKIAEAEKRQRAQSTARPNSRPDWLGHAHPRKAKEKERQQKENLKKQREVRIRSLAEKICRERDPEYIAWTNSKKKELDGVLKQIDHTTYRHKDELLSFERYKDTFLAKINWRQFRADEDVTFEDKICVLKKLPIDQTIDDLEAMSEKLQTKVAEEQPAKTEQKEGDGLTKAERQAYQSYEYAISQKPKLADKTDDEAYNWLKENSLPDYELPSPETWKRYVRRGRWVNGTQKTSPRKGRTGRSIVKADQI